jgi:protein-L-isoaspartate(D-aspartate) O-methyltransferase
VGVGPLTEMPPRARPQARAHSHHIARERMVDKLLVARGICDPRVLEAMRTVPRHLFVGEALRGKAHGDHALPIGEKQTITQPYVVARVAELLELTPDDRVLEIGAGSGYQAAVLSRLARHVYAVERIAALARRAQQILLGLEYINVSISVFDGTYGWGEWAPYAAIAVAAAADEVPEPLLDQLAVGGRLVIPIGGEQEQTLVRIRRTESGFSREEHEIVRFVPLLGRYGRTP